MHGIPPTLFIAEVRLWNRFEAVNNYVLCQWDLKCLSAWLLLCWQQLQVLWGWVNHVVPVLLNQKQTSKALKDMRQLLKPS